MKLRQSNFASGVLCVVMSLLPLMIPGGAFATEAAAPVNPVPKNLAELWAGFDARRDPLEIEVTKEWELDGVIVRVVRYTVGTFKGQKSIVAALYGFPKGADPQSLPAIIDLHGGGQSAYLPNILTAAKRGYACISLNWGGNKFNMYRGPEYDGPNTDWGAVDATHPPQRDKLNRFVTIKPSEFSLESVESPRNSNWFLVLMAARRAITFLEQQPEIDGSRIGVQGHSMGGKLTTNLAGIDPRVKCAVPSCGGSGNVTPDRTDVPSEIKGDISPLELACVSDNAYLPGIKVPILWLSPTNDFHGIYDAMTVNWSVIPQDLVRFAVTPHMNHRHTEAFNATAMIFFAQHLQGGATLPSTPKIEMNLKTANQVPLVTVTPDSSRPVKSVDVYYSNDPQVSTRFWRDAAAQREGNTWTAACPVMSVSEPLFVFANVHYEMSPQELGAYKKGVLVGNTDEFVVSSGELLISPEKLQSAGVRATDVPSRMIDQGTRGWRDWFLLNTDHPPLWQAWTRKLKDAKWRGPDGARLVFEMSPEAANTVVVTIICNTWGAFERGKPTTTWTAVKQVTGASSPQTISVSLEDMVCTDPKNTSPLANWRTVTEMSISPSGETVRDGQKVRIEGKPWKGSRQIQDLRWEGGTEARSATAENPVTTTAPADLQQIRFNEAIQKSLEQERKDRSGK